VRGRRALGQGANYLEASVSFGASRAAHLELARLAEREGRAAEAQKHFRRAGNAMIVSISFLDSFFFRFASACGKAILRSPIKIIVPFRGRHRRHLLALVGNRWSELWGSRC
jgi:hypothetical protein